LNLLTVAMGEGEDCSREEYLQQLVKPLRQLLRRRTIQPSIKCLVLFYGLPLRVAAPELSNEEWKQLEDLKFAKRQVDWQLNQQPQLPAEERNNLSERAGELEQQIKQWSRREQLAALDSELALVLKEDYPLERWLLNPYFVGYSKSPGKLQLRKSQVLLVSRLDGPTPEIVRRMIDDSLRAEAEGLRGRVYFDARWPQPENQDRLKGYALYDNSLHRAAQQAKKLGRLPVVLDQQERLFQPGEAPHAAVYSGWYSLAKYIDAFDWQPGAVAYHIASAECVTLKRPGSQLWCKSLLEDGVAATVGPVAEPYVYGFPLPEPFFSFLLDGYYSLVECYFLSLPYLSWQVMLIGDPLYRPFRNALQHSQ
jgi:uncharacterized protein (TIGR03790 family)